MKLTKSLKQLDKGHQKLSAYLSLHCQHGLTYHGKEKSFELVSKTKFSRKCDVKCKFRINISLHKELNSWWIHNNKKTKMTTDHDHTGHFKMDAGHIHTHISLLPKDEITLAKHCSQLNMPSSNTSTLINIKNVLGINNNWTKQQIYYQNKLTDRLNKLNSSASSAEKASSAEELISMFDERLDTNFLYLTYEPTEGLMLMTGNYHHVFMT